MHGVKVDIGSGVKVYIASPFFSEEQIARVMRVEKALDFNPTVEGYFSPRLNQLDHLPFGSVEWRREVFANDVKHIDWADVVVAVHDFVDDHVDSGTAWEIGYAYATGKPIILVHEKDTKVNLMLSDSLHAYLKRAEYVEGYDFIKMPKSDFTGEVI
jgi:nucleoside 2-deoxyribosyltransferase